MSNDPHRKDTYEDKRDSRKGLEPQTTEDIPNDLDAAERDKQRRLIKDLARDNQQGYGQDEDERSGQGNQGGHGDRGARGE